MIKASLNNYRQSPRKVRLVADMIKGKKVGEAIAALSFLAKDAAHPISKLIKSAVANAKSISQTDESRLYIKNIEVNPGQALKRRMPRARGSAFPIKKRTSHINIILEAK